MFSRFDKAGAAVIGPALAELLIKLGETMFAIDIATATEVSITSAITGLLVWLFPNKPATT